MGTRTRTARRLLALLAWAAASGAAAARADVAAAWPPGPVEVRRVDHAGSVVIARGGATEVLHFDGVDAVGRDDGTLAIDAVEALRTALHGRPAELVAARAGARGELRGLLRSADGTLVNADLLGRGHGLYEPGVLGPGFASLLLLAQEEARAAKAGVWGRPIVAAEDVGRLPQRIATVCGAVGSLRAGDDGEAGVIHLGGAYPRNQLSIELGSEVASGVLPNVRLEQEICATGRLERTPTVPRMRIGERGQVRPRNRDGARS